LRFLAYFEPGGPKAKWTRSSMQWTESGQESGCYLAERDI